MPAAYSAVTLVGLGKFDPNRFLLESLVASKAISEAEADRSKVMALLPDQVVHFTLPWGELLVLRDRLHASATEAPFIRVADIVAQTMSTAEDRCSLRAFGINFEAHYDIGSMAARDAFAMRLAPSDAWGDWGRAIRKSMESTDIEVHGGITVLTMRERIRVGDIRGWYDVTLTSSEKVPNNSGVRFLTNHHHEYAPESPPAADLSIKDKANEQTAALLAALEVGFDDSIEKGERIIAEVMA